MKRYLVQTRPPGTASDDDLATPAPAAAKKPKPAGGGGSGAAAGAAAQQTQQLPTSLVRGGWTQLGQGARVGFWPRRFAAQEQQLLRALLADIAWQQRSVQLFGRSVPQPRLVAYMADHGDLSYTYSGLTLAPEPWLPALAALRDELAALTGARFNSCLLNQYRSGDDSLGWHADDEPVYGPAPTIASVSLGACRDFCLRHARQRSHKLSVALGGGDVLVMAGSTQQHWQHCVPRRKRVPGPRVSLTFRLIVAPQAAAG